MQKGEFLIFLHGDMQQVFSELDRLWPADCKDGTISCKLNIICTQVFTRFKVYMALDKQISEEKDKHPTRQPTPPPPPPPQKKKKKKKKKKRGDCSLEIYLPKNIQGDGQYFGSIVPF